ncbi:prepilin-type N-terminal cleavage/methylation domain-containing protein [Demequina zhanjiangensis]|uniref:Prepilin-type N-terminal cleavage/methylation domain-containing protein n=1 Tax=Demequina zhanjiangensis TaxID=3051659 RepID=A0ABT8FZJ7_9MICO|nr:prepilin-type N-terminal cleavage/methylation domain-containing protein [Demequina sp. SYSU T00b26]MDN4472315.1 prepilin-type N-terminal cleavage/methylation domain-containing protein [Demequina sp. SYSU T00b26]
MQHRTDLRRDDGFNLVEILVVVVIIAVLAAIAVPIYLNHQARAKDAVAQADAMNLGIQIRAAWDDEATSLAVTSDGDYYFINSEKVLGVSPDVEFVGFTGGGAIDDWCVQLRIPGGKNSDTPGVRFDSVNGYVENAACTGLTP